MKAAHKKAMILFIREAARAVIPQPKEVGVFFLTEN